ncbi:MAG: response regulator transcription factor [Acidimicrobiia bacterium]
MRTVLVVDDEPLITDVVSDYLREAGYEVAVAANGSDTLRRVRSAAPDLVILDLGLPDIDGLDVARQIKQVADIPIIMLTARTDEIDRVLGLELGADDYILKPFSNRELVARVRGLFRRLDAVTTNIGPITVGQLIISLDRRTVHLDSKPVELTATEFDLLAAFAKHPGRVFTRSQLLEVIHGIAIDSYERAIDSHIKNIRRKLEPDPTNPVYVLTVHGVGYRFADRAAS